MKTMGCQALLLAAALFTVCSGDETSGFADSVLYSFRTPADADHFLAILEPFATYVREHEQAITYTFRPFRSADNSSVLIVERFIDRAAHDGPHSVSPAHLALKANISAWNESTHAIVGRVHMNLQEASMGAFIRTSPSSRGVSGFADTVLYTLKDTQSREQYLAMLEPLATYVKDAEAEFTYTFRPFLNIDDNKSVLILERFVNKSAHDGPHTASSVHQNFLKKVSAWNESTHAITDKVHGDWQELNMGVLDRKLAKTMKTTWFNYSYVTSGFNLCNEAINVCRSLGHWVFTSAPSNVADSLIAGAAFSVDDGPWEASKRGNFEAHFVNGQCSNTSDASTCTYYDDKRLAQVWNIGYDVIQQGTAASLHLPKKVCAKVWTTVPATGEVGELEPLCATFTTAAVNIPQAAPLRTPDMMYSLSADAATYLCNEEHCRSDGHVSLDVQVLDPTQELLGLTEVSIDGSEWSSAKTNTFFEQKVKHQNDKWYHTISWNYDDVVPKSAPPPKQICIRMAVQNLVTLATWQVDFGEYASKGDRHQRCLAFCDHAEAFSHAPSAGGYCRSKPVDSLVIV